MNILSLEASTSSAKAMIYSDEHGVLDILSIKYPKHIGNIKSQDTDGIIDIVFECCKKILIRNDVKIDIISLASVWHSLLILDKKRKPIQNLSTWANMEAYKTAKVLRQDESFRQKFYAQTGCNIHSKYPVWKLYHQKNNDASFDIQDINISSLPEYLFEKLTSQVVVSKVVASGTGYFNINKLEWDTDILDMLSVKTHQFSKLVDYDYTGKLCESAAKRLGLPPCLPVMVSNSDGALNQICDGGFSEKTITVSVGTSAAIRCAVSKPILPKKPATWCYYLGNKKYILGAATSGACNCVNWFINNFCENKFTFAELEQKLYDVDKNNAPFYLPFNFGEQSPGWNDDRTGSFIGLTGDHKIGDMYYSILEGIVFNVYHCYQEIVKLSGHPEKIVLSGGILSNKFWCQMFSDIFGMKITLSHTKHSSTLGAARVCTISLSKEFVNNDYYASNGYTNNNENKIIYMNRYQTYLSHYNLTIST